MKYLSLAVMLLLAGCKIEQQPSATVNHDQIDSSAVNYSESSNSSQADRRHQELVDASRRAAAYADSVAAEQWVRHNGSRADTVLVGPSYAAAKVAAVMDAEGITLPQVAAYLFANGWQVVPAPMSDWTWTKPTTGSPVAYYVWEMRGACADTVLLAYLPAVAGNYALRVRGVDTQQRIGPWSLVGVTGDGTLLPGVEE